MSTIINFKTDEKIKAQAQKIAEKMGLNLSDVLNIYLRSFIKKKEIYISLAKDESNPTERLLSAVAEARSEYKTGKMKKFSSVADLSAHLKKL